LEDGLELWWNGINRGISKYFAEKRAPVPLVHHKSHMADVASNPSFRGEINPNIFKYSFCTAQ
jgi:hypothetical protein